MQKYAVLTKEQWFMRVIYVSVLHTTNNRADFVSWCMLYTYEGNKIHSWENDDVYFRGLTIKSHSLGEQNYDRPSDALYCKIMST